MRGVLVEDDAYKVEQICEFLKSINISVAVKRAFTSGIKEISSERPDFVLLDMTIPTYEVDRNHPTSRNRKFGGRDILREMKRQGIISRTVVITQYSVFGEEEITLEELDSELREEFPTIYEGLIYYNASALDWQDKLQKFILRENKDV